MFLLQRKILHVLFLTSLYHMLVISIISVKVLEKKNIKYVCLQYIPMYAKCYNHDNN